MAGNSIPRRIIAHLDMDAFFAAVEETDRPSLKGLPIAVGADPREGRGRGVVATANYKAREYGLHSALPISVAWGFSERARRQGKPPVVFLPPRFDRYVEVSGRIVSLVRAHVSRIERAGLDEMYLDMTACPSYEDAAAVARRIKADIRRVTGLTASIGIGPNKLIAKIASDRNKPDGLTIVRDEEAEHFLDPLSVRKLPGVGPKTEARLNEMGIRTVRELKSAPPGELAEAMGKWGAWLLGMARGRDDSPVEESGEIKSIGEQETFLEDTLDAGLILSRLEDMAARVIGRMKAEGFKGFRTGVLIIRFADFETRTKSTTVKSPVSTADGLMILITPLLEPFLNGRQNPELKMVRLIGLRVEKLVGTEPQMSFL